MIRINGLSFHGRHIDFTIDAAAEDGVRFIHQSFSTPLLENVVEEYIKSGHGHKAFILFIDPKGDDRIYLIQRMDGVKISDWGVADAPALFKVGEPKVSSVYRMRQLEKTFPLSKRPSSGIYQETIVITPDYTRTAITFDVGDLSKVIEAFD